MAVKSYLNQFANIVSDVLNIDVIIVDSNLNLLGQKLVFYDMYQKIDYGSLIYTVIESGEQFYVKNRESVPKCKECKGYAQCKIDGFVGVPIRDKTEVIGALALIVSKKRGKNFFEKIDSTFLFMDNMAELIGKRIIEHQSKKKIRERLTRAESIIAAIPEALLYCDRFGNIIYHNASFQSIFQLKNPINNIRDLSEELEKYLQKGKGIEEAKITIEKGTYSFYGTISLIPVSVEDDKKEFLCKFKSYSQIQKESNVYSTSTMVTFSWLSKYVGKETIEECKNMALKNECLLIKSEDNALNELIGKAIVNYSDRRLKQLKVIYMQNVYRELMNTFMFDDRGMLWQMQGGSLIIVQPEKMLLIAQEKLARYLEKELEKVKKREQEQLSIQFVFCTSENLEDLVREKLFSYRLYSIIVQNKIVDFQTVYNNKAVFERFFHSAVLYYSKMYGKKESSGIDELYQKLWKLMGKKDLSTIETYLESYFKNDGIDEKELGLISYEGTVKDMERNGLEQLIKGDYTVKQICQRLGISRSSFYRKIEQYQLDYKKRKE